VPADAGDRLDKPSYDLKSLPRKAAFLHALQETLGGWGRTVLQLDHEDAHGQYEVNFAYDEALASADHLMGFKLAAQALAEREGWVFSMMPKPFANQPGSGLHFHVSLWDLKDPAHGKGLFSPSADERAQGHDLSLLGRQFIAGVLAHAPALCALAAPTVNSYKRLVVGNRSRAPPGPRPMWPTAPTTAPPRSAPCPAASSGGCPTPAPTPTWPPRC
jgi:glutamine synthetase